MTDKKLGCMDPQISTLVQRRLEVNIKPLQHIPLRRGARNHHQQHSVRRQAALLLQALVVVPIASRTSEDQTRHGRIRRKKERMHSKHGRTGMRQVHTPKEGHSVRRMRLHLHNSNLRHRNLKRTGVLHPHRLQEAQRCHQRMCLDRDQSLTDLLLRIL